MLSVPETL